MKCPEGQSYNSKQRKCLNENATPVAVTPIVAAPVIATPINTTKSVKTNYLTNPSTNGLIIDTDTV